MAYLANWLEDLLDDSFFKRKKNDFYFHGNEEPNIRLLHFDVLPTRLAEIKNTLQFDSYHKNCLSKSIDKICLSKNINRTDYEDIFDLSFLYDEYVRVIYGQQYETSEQYQTGERKGRPFRLNHNSLKRELIYSVIQDYLFYLKNNETESVFTRRHKLLRMLKRGNYRKMFTHIFVDEFQDCTQADYQIFYGLLENPNNLVVAGDFAQAVHLGKTASIPREDNIFAGSTRMRNIETKKLEGSYRLPFRISECIKPLSKKIKLINENSESDIITPYKGAPPGARPIVVYANDTEEMKNKLFWIVWYYKTYQAVDIEDPFNKRINILEQDRDLSIALNSHKRGIAETETILKLKGLEKECVVWSTRIKITDLDEVFNYIYTILTRTSSLLIIALFPNSPNYVGEALTLMNKEKMILWDQETNIYCNELIKNKEIITVE